MYKRAHNTHSHWNISWTHEKKKTQIYENGQKTRVALVLSFILNGTSNAAKQLHNFCVHGTRGSKKDSFHLRLLALCDGFWERFSFLPPHWREHQEKNKKTFFLVEKHLTSSQPRKRIRIRPWERGHAHGGWASPHFLTRRITRPHGGSRAIRHFNTLYRTSLKRKKKKKCDPLRTAYK